MNIKIIGAGMAGAYLYALLDQHTSHELIIVDKTKNCGHECAWGTHYNPMDKLLEEVDLDIDDHLLARPKVMEVIGVGEKKLHDFITISKPGLIDELTDNNILDTEEFDKLSAESQWTSDLIIDASGYARVMLPKIEDDILIKTVQTMETNDELDQERVYVQKGKLGYSWAFPLSKNLWHMGYGDLAQSNYFMDEKFFGKRLCRCESYVRLTGPTGSLPFQDGSKTVIGVGESIGTVHAFSGEGIVPSMECATLLANNLDRPEIYEAKVQSKFHNINKEAQSLRKYVKSPSLSWLFPS